MATPTKSAGLQTFTLCAALALAAACGDRDAAAGARAALSAECSDPNLIVESQTLNLWPPNHKFHDVTVGDCISAVSSCEGELQGEFIWASSDEPIDDIGDGHHMPDIGLGVDTGHVCVRSERQGPMEGRVYKLGVSVVDASGEAVERECLVLVDHDQRGVVAADSGEAYRIEFDPSEAGLDCEGNPVEEPPGGGAGTGGGAGNGGDPCTDPDGCVEEPPGGGAGETGGGAGDDGGGAGDDGGGAGETGGGAGDDGGGAGDDGGGAGDDGGGAGDDGGGTAGNGGDPQSPGGGPE